ncbi:FliM/FliN family flagellar motor switch protein [Mangrovicoccus ximenensis]|uniref:FliM/FliN family flagellar motor switch protein n=1 Tax=Mangrovicoccus ximenensis TaxID=1911570 RepID=UPI000D337BA8|nr:FliM/FliN family flagellar motor switch protein [Mangrovicoccus ximenensis]
MKTDVSSAKAKFGVLGVILELKVVVGIGRLTFSEMIDIPKDTIVPLGRNLRDPVDLYVGDRLIGYGELEEVECTGEGMLGVRIIEIFKND